MRRSVLLLVIVMLPAAAAFGLDAYPKTTLAEAVVATWCSYCPQAYQGLDVVHSQYDTGEFLSARYYSSSSGGGLSSAEVDARISYYGVGSFPTVIFNGTEKVVGGGTAVATGVPYLGTVASTYFDPAPIKVEITSFNPTSGAISALVTMYSATATLTNDSIRFVLLEDNVTYQAKTYQHVTRTLLNDTISLSGAGNTASFTKGFTVNPAWVPANLHAVVLVQLADKTVVQAASTEAPPDFQVRGIVPSSRMQMGPGSGFYNSEPFAVYNTGLADTFTISAVVDSAPPGWMLTFCDELGGCHTDPYAFGLGQDDSTDFHATVIPTSAGMMKYHFEVTSPNLTQPLVIPFAYVTDNLDALVVDDDGGTGYEGYSTAALTAAGKTWGVWNRTFGALTAQAAAAYRLLVWEVGDSYPSLDVDDRAFLEAYLDSGRNLFLTGQDIGWDLNDSGSGNADAVFYHTYLHATYLSDDTNLYTLNGVAGDPVSDGLVLSITGGDGANNQAYPSSIAPYDANATGIFNYQGGTNPFGAIRATHGTAGARIVYLAFGYEAVNSAASRAALMDRATAWLLNIIFDDNFESAGTTAWSSVVP